uniref:C2H2-type domain-containing protein n=1 Tax=viral metagenome TaxID=1070528 RepID=A0A6C0H5L2_9ZZZZ
MDKYVCLICNKKYASLNSLNNHKRNYHNNEEDKKYKCDYCIKEYVFRQSKHKHQKKCKNNPTVINTNNNINNTINNNTINNTINNIINNNNITNNYKVIINFNSKEDKEAPNKIFSEEDKFKISKMPYYDIIPKMLETKLKYKELNNVKINNLKDKFAFVYKNGKMECVSKEYAIQNLYNNCYWGYSDIYYDLHPISEKVKKQFDILTERFEDEEDKNTVEVENVSYKNMKKYNENKTLLLLYNNKFD